MDCSTALERIAARCLEIGINCIAVADHGTIAGALRLKEIAPFKLIVAEEILTPIGELMGLFLTEEVPSGLPAEETIARIKSQGGLVSIPHPFGRPLLRGSKELVSRRIVSQVDIIEVFNSRTPLPNSSAKAWRLAQEHKLAVSAGSDAHTVAEIGRAYVEMPEFNSVGDFLDSLSLGKIFGHSSSPLVHFASAWAKTGKRLGFHPHVPRQIKGGVGKDSLFDSLLSRERNKRLFSNSSCHSERSEESRPFTSAQGDKINNLRDKTERRGSC
jgi:hypothetical protein